MAFPPVYIVDDLELRPYQEIDRIRLREIWEDPVSVEVSGDEKMSLEESNALFDKIFTVYSSENDRWFWLWGLYREDLLIGHIELKDSENTTNEELEIVYFLHPTERRKGSMTKLLSFIRSKQVEWERRVIATVNPKNVASLGLLEKWGVESKERIDEEDSDYWYWKLRMRL